MARELMAVTMCLSLAGCVRSEVVRLVDGVPQTGRYVPVAAYAAYARGAEAEAREQHAQAAQYYVQALRSDDRSTEVWTRLGAVRCRIGDAAGAEDAFEEALGIDESYGPAWSERARCAERNGDHPRALKHAESALALYPTSVEVALTLARLHDALGRAARARRLLHEQLVLHPASPTVLEAALRFAERRGDYAWRDELRGRLTALEGRSGVVRDSTTGWEAIDRALRLDDLATARRRARKQRLAPHLLAARALALGKPKLALEHAGLRLAANPRDGDALVATALANDLLGKPALLGEVLARVPDRSPSLSAAGRLLLAELLERHAGAEAAALAVGGDRSWRKRLRAELERGVAP